MIKAGVIGSGSWATAIVKTLERNNIETNWWIKDHRIISFIKRYRNNPYYLRAVELNIKAENMFTNIEDVVAQSDYVFLVLPSLYLKESLADLPKNVFEGKKIVSAIKGLIPGNNQIISDYMNSEFNVPLENFTFLTGPSHAEEVVKKRLTYITMAHKTKSMAVEVGGLLENNFLKIRTSQEVKALEYASVLKNIYAIASGISHSLGYGDNFQAVLISNAIREMSRFLKKGCCGSGNIMSSGFLGDLLVTSYSQLSRNRTFGNFIGHGYSPKAALLEMSMVPEGYYAVKAFNQIQKDTHVRMRIVKTVYRILHKQKDPTLEFQSLEKFLT